MEQERRSRARERYEARRRRHVEKRQVSKPRGKAGTLLERGLMLAQDLGWYLRNQPWIWQGVGVMLVVLAILFYLTHAVTGRIYPNISALGVPLGGLGPVGAANTLTNAWANDLQIDVVIQGEVVEQLSPAALGLQLDADATAAAAQEIGINGIFGQTVEPVVALSEEGYLTAQNYLLELAESYNKAPFNAGFEWRGEQLMSVPGREGRLLDIALTMAAIEANPGDIVQNKHLVIQTSSVPPDVMDASSLLDQARAFVETPLEIRGYDPYAHDFVNWTTDKQTVTTWLEASPDGLTLREETFAPFINAQIQTLNGDDSEDTRYLDNVDTIETMQRAIENQSHTINLRIRYQPQNYVVVAGDTASSIARKTGIPFYLLERSNPGRDLNILSVGDTLRMPTRDVTMPHAPVANKRIIVNLETQMLYAFEDGQQVFSWSISSGRSSAPTSPGIYQILDHNEVAHGSSYTMCDDMGCGQWEMSWFMGIYEVVPGLVNGFHGAVLLPNGGYLNGGATGSPSTFGCVMSHDDDAQRLFEWAEQGTVVEIISDEFDPMSGLAMQTTQEV